MTPESDHFVAITFGRRVVAKEATYATSETQHIRDRATVPGCSAAGHRDAFEAFRRASGAFLRSCHRPVFLPSDNGTPTKYGPDNDVSQGAAMTFQINITPNGRMSLPADIRKRLGLTGGGAIYLDETEDGIVLRTATQSVARAQALAKQYTGDNPDASVDAFLARRRDDSGE
ncbi:AbrB family looped-hinge helix DNA binding protein [Sphingomonas xinjiangensis]|uniref:AbrB family looped-hinge helix DNA binding protein n=2 Tax=Sphingomonas xinjiangensis TaxID=643568 RepID=A0A840YGX0_9SPHN|nr:AbrB family looped-hinge helix DNA binding protein [Sphingomonas xinjiangensis]